MKDEKGVKKLLEKKAKLEDDKGQVMEDLLKGIINLAERIEVLEGEVKWLKERTSLRPLISSFENPLPPCDGAVPELSPEVANGIGACIGRPTRPATEEEVQFWMAFMKAKREEDREYEEWEKRKEDKKI